MEQYGENITSIRFVGPLIFKKFANSQNFQFGINCQRGGDPT
jgi:hypothetical protein